MSRFLALAALAAFALASVPTPAVAFVPDVTLTLNAPDDWGVIKIGTFVRCASYRVEITWPAGREAWVAGVWSESTSRNLRTGAVIWAQTMEDRLVVHSTNPAVSYSFGSYPAFGPGSLTMIANATHCGDSSGLGRIAFVAPGATVAKIRVDLWQPATTTTKQGSGAFLHTAEDFSATTRIDYENAGLGVGASYTQGATVTQAVAPGLIGAFLASGYSTGMRADDGPGAAPPHAGGCTGVVTAYGGILPSCSSTLAFVGYGSAPAGMWTFTVASEVAAWEAFHVVAFGAPVDWLV